MDDWLEDIEARAHAATPPPWMVDASGDSGEPFDVDVVDETGGYAGTVLSANDLTGDTDQAHANALFAAYARADIPRLVAEVRRLRSVVASSAMRTECTRRAVRVVRASLREAPVVADQVAYHVEQALDDIPLENVELAPN